MHSYPVDPAPEEDMLHNIPFALYLSLSAASLGTAPVTTPAPVSSATSTTAKRTPMALVERRLRDLVMQQESWYVKQGRYGWNAYRAGLERKGDSTAFSEVHVEILYAGRIGWSALASHPSAPGKTCVVYVGFRERLPVLPRTREGAKEALLEGMPACDK